MSTEGFTKVQHQSNIRWWSSNPPVSGGGSTVALQRQGALQLRVALRHPLMVCWWFNRTRWWCDRTLAVVWQNCTVVEEELGPGATPFTLIPFSTNCRASPLVNATIAPFVAV
ncbi:hypothetical protein M5K25_005147 [Dendrobium thyrsiflorum]|uniref:Uncharacterized protein n=1 Tax=Dendrobium thyrsiflorum TaxID=117978 RepID=A0ABD0VI45_DENTH